MNRLKMMLMGAALVAASSALASAQSRDDRDRHERRFEDRDHDRGRHNGRRFDRDRDDRRFRDRDDRRFVDRDDRWRFRDRDDRFFYSNAYYGYRVGETRWFNGYNWYWDGQHWCRRHNGVVIYFRF